MDPVWTNQIFLILFLFYFLVFSEEINVYPSLPVQTYENGRFPGIWKFPVSGKGRLNLHAYTEAKENFVKTGCPSWKLFVTMNDGSPVLANEFYENAEESFFPSPKPWFTDDFDLKQLDANSEVGNMKNISIDLSGFQGNQVNELRIDSCISNACPYLRLPLSCLAAAISDLQMPKLSVFVVGANLKSHRE